jgi:hypothetical protein
MCEGTRGKCWAACAWRFSRALRLCVVEWSVTDAACAHLRRMMGVRCKHHP